MVHSEIMLIETQRVSSQKINTTIDHLKVFQQQAKKKKRNCTLHHVYRYFEQDTFSNENDNVKQQEDEEEEEPRIKRKTNHQSIDRAISRIR